MTPRSPHLFPLFPAALLLLIASPAPLLAQEPAAAPQLTAAERQALQDERHRLWDEALRLDKEGKRADAIVIGQTTLAIHRRLRGRLHPDTARDLQWLAERYEGQEDFSAAKHARAEVLEIQLHVHGKDNWRVTDARLAISQTEALARFMPEQRRQWREAQARYEEAARWFGQGRYAEARAAAAESAELRKSLSGKDHPLYVASLFAVAYADDLLGETTRAEALYRQVLEIRKEKLGTAHPAYAETLNNLAVLYQSQGDFARAEPLCRAALETTRTAFGAEHPQYAAGLNNLALLYQSQGDYPRATALCEQALAIRKKAAGEADPDYSRSLFNLGFLHHAQGDLVQAEPLYRRTLEIQKQVLGTAHPEYATTLNNLAMLYQAQGDFARAEPLCRQVLQIKQEALSEWHPEYATALNNLALVYHAQGDIARAEPLYRESLNVARRNLDLAALTQSEQQQLRMASVLRPYLDMYLSIAVDSGRFGETAYEQVLAWKGMIGARQRALRAAADEPKLAAKFASLESTARDLARQALSAAPSDGREAWQRKTEELSQRLESLTAELAGEHAAYRTAARPLSLAEARRAIGDNVLLDFVEYQRVQRDERAAGGLFRELRVAVFVVPAAGEIRLVDLESSGILADATDAWRAGFGQSAASREAGQLLRARIWDKVEPYLAGARQVLVAPDGPLCRLPLAALPGRKPDTYLIEDWALALIPAPQSLAEFGRIEPLRAGEAGPAPRAPGAGNLLVLGGVDYDADLATTAPRVVSGQTAKVFGRPPAERNGETQKFSFLPGSRGELATIQVLYNQNFGKDGLTILDADRATEAAFRQEARRHLYLHVATHGFFAPPNVKSALSRSARDLARFEGGLATGQSLADYHPNLLSGLALAGANKPLPEGDDGILTAEEIQALDLRGVELVVLSACETGLGERARGEGLLGLQRSFQVAGAKTVIASLWKVDDVATRDLMERFYENLWSKTKPDGTPLYTKLEALREAQLWMLKERGPRGATPVEADLATAGEKRLPPYYWAAFVLSGDWR